MEAMLDEGQPFHPRNLYRFSDLEETDLRKLEKTWPDVSPQRRQAILEDIEEIGETNYTLSFEEFCRFAIHDANPRVRELSVRVLWEYENKDLVPLFLNLLANDGDPSVRAASATALGKYVYLGEIEDIPDQTLNDIIDRLLEVQRGSDETLIRRRALESLGYSSHAEVTNLIEAAFNSGIHDWIVSALFAMSRSANARWGSQVLDMIESYDYEIRFEAIRAAGELEVKRAVTPLLNLLDESDSDTRMAAIWALSQIGGEGIQDALEQLYDETEDEEEAEFIDLAIENLMFTEDLQAFGMFDFSPDDILDESNGNGIYNLENDFDEGDD